MRSLDRQSLGYFGADELRRGPAEPAVGSEHPLDVAGARDHLVFAVEHEKQAMGLYRARNVDRLLVADGQVETVQS